MRCSPPQCRARMADLPQICRDLSRCLWLKGAATITMAANECVCGFSVSEKLQIQMLEVLDCSFSFASNC